LLEVGAGPDRITVIGNGIDVEAFAASVERVRERREEIRNRFDLEGPTALSVGGKGIDLALGAMDHSRSACHLLLVGSRARPNRFPGLVDVGQVPAAAMPEFYAAADCLVHPPVFDQWPHAINEALSAGLPVVATSDTGIPREALSGPGCAVVPRDVESLSHAVDDALAQRTAANAAVRGAIRDRIRPWSVSEMAKRWVSALSAAFSERNGIDGA